MKLISQKTINWLNIGEIFFFLFLIAIFFPIRYVFLSNLSFSTGTYSDFATFSLYLSDIFLFLTWIFILFSRGKDFFILIRPFLVFLVWVLIVFFMHLNRNWDYNLYFLLKLTEFIVAYGTAAVLFKEKPIKSWFLWALGTLATLQSLIALAQFHFQRPIGLFKIGEQQIYPLNQGIAKVISHGEVYIRGYGTFPHPNPLSAFLIIGILLAIYLFSQTQKTWQQVLLCSIVFINILGLTVTFSRAAFLAFGFGFIIYFELTLFRFLKQGEGKIRSHIAILIITLISVTISITIFHTYLITRTTVSDQASVERRLYNKIGTQMLKHNTIFGVGIGESVLHMQQYSPRKLWPWEIQPIHNYFLLSATELGIPGALILIWIFLFHLKAIINKIKKGYDPFLYSLFTILSLFLILMFFDHYFYTLQQTQMLLWIILGIIASETKKSPQGDSLKPNT